MIMRMNMRMSMSEQHHEYGDVDECVVHDAYDGDDDVVDDVDNYDDDDYDGVEQCDADVDNVEYDVDEYCYYYVVG